MVHFWGDTKQVRNMGGNRFRSENRESVERRFGTASTASERLKRVIGKFATVH
jgi:hypothetical protein